MKHDFKKFNLPRTVRDARVSKGIKRVLLLALALRADAKDACCFPSYAQLALDTGYSDPRLRVAAKELEELGFIVREERPNTTNNFYLNVQRLTELAAANQEADRVSRLAAKERRNPFEYEMAYTDESDQADAEGSNDPAGPQSSPNHWDDDTDGIGLEPQQATNGTTGRFRLSSDHAELLHQVQAIWPTHAAFQDAGHLSYLEMDLKECIRIAGSPERASELLYYISLPSEDATRSLVEKSSKLGPYLVACFPKWDNDFSTVLNPDVQNHADNEAPDEQL